MRATRSLPCELTEKQLLVRCDELAHALDQIEAKKRQKKEVVEEFTEEIDALESKMKSLARIIRDGTEPRDVEVLEVRNETTFTVEYVRQDTLEAIESRPMSEDEIAKARQGKLPLEGKAKKGKPPATSDGGGPTNGAA